MFLALSNSSLLLLLPGVLNSNPFILNSCSLVFCFSLCWCSLALSSCFLSQVFPYSLYLAHSSFSDANFSLSETLSVSIIAICSSVNLSSSFSKETLALNGCLRSHYFLSFLVHYLVFFKSLYNLTPDIQLTPAS